MPTAAEAGESSQWVKRTSLVDSRTSVTDVQFASKHQGLQLVCGLADEWRHTESNSRPLMLFSLSLSAKKHTSNACSSVQYN